MFNEANIYIGPSFIFFVLMLTLAMRAILREIITEFPRKYRYVIVAGSTLALMLTIVAHELSHYLAIRLYGMKIAKAGFYFFGAFVRPQTPVRNLPWDQLLVISLAGPLTNICIGAAILFFTIRLPEQSLYKNLLRVLAAINIILGVSNLLPFAGLDGGYILMALTQHIIGNKAVGIIIPYVISGLCIFALLFSLIFTLSKKKKRSSF
ncbi:MAG: site-2 protease family protein [Patescibacteria group bacterium]